MLPPAAIVAKALSAKRISNGWIACCPAHDDRAPSMTISTGRDGRTLLHCWSGCSFEAVAAAVEAITGSDDAPQERREATPIARRSLGSIEAALRTWGAAGPLCEVSKLYLERRGILTAIGVSALRSVKLKHPETGEVVPTILVPRMNDAGGIVGIQRIFLDPADGTKYRDGTAKMSLGDGGTSMLSPPTSTGGILLAEGPETALAASLMFDRPAWACCSGFPQRAVKWGNVSKVYLIVDNDRIDFKKLHAKTSQEKADVFVKSNPQLLIRTWIPETTGYDAADVWMERICDA